MKILKRKDHVCSHRHSFALDNFFRRLIQSPKKIVGPYVQEGDTVLDLGCGPGYFTIPMAEMVGEEGSVLAVDLQDEMLDIVAGKLFDSPLALRVQVHKCTENSLDFATPMQADFILAYYMVHETGDKQQFFEEVREILKPGGSFLIVEPPFHVKKRAFEEMIRLAEQIGFAIIDRPKRKGGMAVLLSPSTNS